MDTKEFNVERFSAELSRINKEYQKLDDTPYNQGAKDVLDKVIYELHSNFVQPEEEVQD